ncbi:MAG: hypothetical protein M3Q16_02225 [Pseudomonadota bacterium]|nr:hypothetical protein [Pseudomonadota bacterium]
MPKAEPLTSDTFAVPQITPKAATLPRGNPAHAKTERAPKTSQMPLQVRLPRDEVRAIKIAAAEREQTISDFMLTCFHAYMEACKHASLDRK